MQNFDAIRGGLIVSCQAEGDDPFNRPELLALFARAAAMGGAVGIRASGCENIAAIRAAVDLPVIGITKGVFPDGSVLITAAFADVGMLIDAGAQLVALDVTQRVRPNGLTGCDFLQAVKERYDVAVMADVATLAEGIAASEAGADFVAPTLTGHTPYCSRPDNGEPDWALVEDLVKASAVPVIMEGGIWTIDQACRAVELGGFAVVVGTAITRPRLVTRAFVEAIADHSR